MTLEVAYIWWRQVQRGEFFNIERAPGLVPGGGGARYIEIPGSLVQATQTFLGVAPDANGLPTEATIPVRTIGRPDVVADLQFLRKSGGRMRIANQNRQAPDGHRHPAWTAEHGFPKAPDDVRDRFEAERFLPAGGLRIYIVKTVDGEYYAGHTKGAAPATLRPGHPMRRLYGTGLGGLIDGGFDV